MKAKVIATGEIVEVKYSHQSPKHDESVYVGIIDYDRYWLLRELQLDPQGYIHTIDWEQRRFELAKAAAQGLSTVDDERGGLSIDNIAEISIEIADAVIKKLKEGQP